MHFLLNLVLLVLVLIPAISAEDFPIAISYRKALTGSGYVVTMKNTSAGSLRVKFSALDKNPERVMDANATWELGHAEGFTFATGDKFSVTVGDKTLQQKIPAEKPIDIAYRKSLLGSSLILVLQRNMESVKEVTVVCERPSNGDKKTFTVSKWGVTNQLELGHTDGWAFQKGDKVTVSGEEFETMTKTFE